MGLKSLRDCSVEHLIKRAVFSTVYVYVHSVRSKRLEAINSPTAYILLTAAGTLAGEFCTKLLENEQKLHEMAIILLTCAPLAAV